jgi:hypothetical protein
MSASTTDQVGAAVTTTTRVPLVCSGSVAFNMTVDTTAPVAVPQGQGLAFDMSLRDMFTIPAPYAGTLSTAGKLTATAAAPAVLDYALPDLVFATGEPITHLGSTTVGFVNNGAPGDVMTVRLALFSYEIAPDHLPGQTIGFDCVPPPDAPAIAVVRTARVPQNVSDCYNGGWRSSTNAAGVLFTSQRACVAYVRNAGS